MALRARSHDLLVDLLCAAGSGMLAPLRARRSQELLQGAAIRRVLVLNDVRGLGNLVLLTGLLYNVKRLFPGARISIAMPDSEIARELLPSELADEILPYCDLRSEWWAFARDVIRPRRFDLGLATFFSDTLVASLALAFGGCTYRAAYAASQRRGFLNTHTLLDASGAEIDRHLRLLEFSGKPLERRTWLAVSEASQRAAGDWLRERNLGGLRPLLGVHPGCDHTNRVKRWPIDRFAEVLDAVHRRDAADVLVFLGPDEQDLRVPLEQRVGDRVHFSSATSLSLTAALIGRCSAFLSNDSGLMHVAAGLGVPVAAIFGPTDSVKNQPIGAPASILSVEVPCRPCYREPPIRCQFARTHCLEDVAVERVLGAVRSILQAGAAEAVARRAACDSTGEMRREAVGHVG